MRLWSSQQRDHTCRCRYETIHYRDKEMIMNTLWLLGGLGLGAGLMYMLDPEKGAGRRNLVRGSIEDYGHQTGALLDETRRTMGRQAQAMLATRRMPFKRQPGMEERWRTQVEEWGLPLGLGLLGCVGLGVGLGALFEPQGGPQRRARLGEYVRSYWHPTATRRAPRQELHKAWRFFQGHDTRRVDAHTRKPAQPQAWYAEPKDYESPVLYSEPFVTREEAEAWAQTQDRQ
jgi:hypothetical protein